MISHQPPGPSKESSQPEDEPARPPAIGGVSFGDLWRLEHIVGADLEP